MSYVGTLDPPLVASVATTTTTPSTHRGWGRGGTNLDGQDSPNRASFSIVVPGSVAAVFLVNGAQAKALIGPGDCAAWQGAGPPPPPSL